MGRIAVFHGADHKAGVSQTALAAAESAAERYPYLKVLLITAHGQIGDEYLPDVRLHMDEIRPYLLERIMDGREAAESALYRGNLYAVAGDRSPASSENYLPDMCSYMLEVFSEDFDLIVCDGGAELEDPMALGALFSADRVYHVLRQSEVCFSRAERLMSLYSELGLGERRYVVNAYDRSMPFECSYAAKRLQAEAALFCSVRASKRGFDAEVERRSLYSFRESGYRKDVDLLSEDMLRSMGIVKEDKENRWLRKNSVSARF